MLDPVGREEDHDDERPQPQDEAPGRVPVFLLRFLQNKDSMVTLELKNAAVDTVNGAIGGRGPLNTLGQQQWTGFK